MSDYVSYDYDAPTKKAYKQADVGVDTAVLYMFADIGTHEKDYNGEKKMQRCVYLGWELPNQKTDDGKTSLSIVKEYTLSFHEKAALRKAYLALARLDKDPERFSPASLLGAGCNLNIGRTSGGNAKVVDVFPLKAKEKTPNLGVDPVFFDLRNPNEEALARLPGFIKEKILASPEYQKYVLSRGKSTEDILNDSVPF